MTFSETYALLRRKSRKQYFLLTGCCFFSVLLITAYVCMMRSPTILTVLPEGGDSRKQVMMVFALTVIGCGVFTAYASGLFFRQKSRETGIFLALGASRAQLRRELGKELSLIAFGSCTAGAALGAPLAWGLWQIFRLCIVDTDQMPLSFDPKSYLLALIFSLYVIVMLFLMGARFIRRTNIIDIVQESHKSEPIHAVPRWYGVGGIFLLILGAVAGYMMPSFFILGLHWYAPEWVNYIFYLPALIGMYWILLHTVVNGWGKHKKYKNLISNSMMKFQGRQTVRNMLVMTLLIAGAYFASFYTPMLGTGAIHQYDSRKEDYVYHWCETQDIPEQTEVQALAQKYGVEITSWAQQPVAVLGTDGTRSVETETGFGVTYTKEYQELMFENNFISESAYTALTGQQVDIKPGTITGVFHPENGGGGIFGGNAKIITNMVTGQRMQVEPTEEKLMYDMLFGYFVMDDTDYAAITAGLTPEWQENIVFFNVRDCKNSYPFAKALFNEIIDRSDETVEVVDSYDRVDKILTEQKGESYWLNKENRAEHGLETFGYDRRDASDFRIYWKYMPKFRVLDKNDFVRTLAVFLTLFIFISVVCFAAVVIIAFTRSMTIAAVNAKVYDDLRHLGASNAYLYESVRGQMKRIFLVPAIVGTTLIYLFYLMILYFNGEPLGITASEMAGLASCMAVIVALSFGFYLVYRLTRRSVCHVLGIRKPQKK